MSILIKGLDMPKDGDILYIDIYSTGKVAHDLDLECKQIATAIPVPPHGRTHDGVTCPNNGAIDCNPTCKRCLQVWLEQEAEDGE